MNNERPSSTEADQFKSLQILDELSNNDSITQRDLSKRLGIALGLVNSYIKNLAIKGFITIKTIPPMIINVPMHMKPIPNGAQLVCPDAEEDVEPRTMRPPQPMLQMERINRMTAPT